MAIKTVVLTTKVKALTIDELVSRYALSNQADGKSYSTVGWYNEILTSFSGYVKSKLGKNGLSVFTLELARGYILYLHQKPRFEGHPYTPQQDKTVSARTVQCHVRALKAFSSWLYAEGYTPENRLKNLKIPKAPVTVVEPATIKLEERELFKAVMAEAMNLKKDGLGNGLCFSRVDRLSRQFEAAVQIALDCRKHGLTLRFVRENQWLRPDDEPIHFVMFILHALGVDTKTKVDRASLKGGQHKAAEAGKLPAGVGPGFLGYTLVNKHFEPDTFIAVCDEVLDRGIQGHLGGQYLQKLT